MRLYAACFPCLVCFIPSFYSCGDNSLLKSSRYYRRDSCVYKAHAVDSTLYLSGTVLEKHHVDSSVPVPLPPAPHSDKAPPTIIHHVASLTHPDCEKTFPYF